MQSEEFLNQVQNRAGLAGRDEAARTCQAVLGVFGQLKVGGELKDAASQLPKDIDQMLVRAAEPEKFDAGEFISRIQTQLDISKGEAETAATAVLSTLSTAVTEGERVELVKQLPSDFTGFTTAK